MLIKKLTLKNWNQFEDVEIDLHPRLTVITGANGAGKSTALRILSRLLGWNLNETATPFKLTKGKLLRYKLGGRRNVSLDDNSTFCTIGSVLLESDLQIELQVPDKSPSAGYQVNLMPQGMYNPPKGLNIPSHRSPYSYRQIQSIPVRPHTRSEAFHRVNNSIMNRLLHDSYDMIPSYHMKETLISLAVFGKGNEYVSENTESYSLFLGFIQILSLLLPPTLGFQTITIRDGEVVLVTASGEFLLDAVSGGIGAIIDLAWQIFMYDSEGEPFLVLIDEAENHLHASMQRRLLPNLIQAFPNTQFIISTHSPLMVNSVKDSLVYVLKYNENNLVVSELLDFDNKSANASQILRDVLGVPVTVPLWVEHVLVDTLDKYRGSELNADSYIQLKQDLSEIGLSDHLPQALGYIQGGGLY
ncbi:AAA family ATPase [Brevibacillus fortis]|uniref:AAA family ATPase n=1 Tax=Brevibacillus fortis TaxID=2126352 RepID=UPI0038FC1927